MIYSIKHKLEYHYSSPVSLDPHRVLLKPCTDGSQTLKQFVLKINPHPFQVTEITDALGNPGQEIWFDGKTENLTLEASSIVEVTRKNPFDYVLRSDSLHLPVKYPASLVSSLKPFLEIGKEDPHVREFAAMTARRAGFEPIGFLSQLCLIINRHIQHIRRDEGFPWRPEKTLAAGKGACRDMAVLFIACCRSQGLAARFTSGYAFQITDDIEDDLHAWAEVYLEGAGWRGYDPSSGLAVADQHITLASAPDAELVTPVAGAFRASKVTTALEAWISIQQKASVEQEPLELQAF